jgi:hypothetical protein
MIDADPTLTRLPPLTCPHCGHFTDAAGTVDGEPGTPSTGDVCGCMYCGCPLVFDRDPLTGLLGLRKMTLAEADALSGDQKQELARVQFFARAVMQPGRN